MVLATVRDRNCRVIWDKELFEDHRSLQFPGLFPYFLLQIFDF